MAAGGCKEGARIEDVGGGIKKPCVSWSRPLTLVTGKGVMGGGAR